MFGFVLLPFVLGLVPPYVVALVARSRRPHMIDIFLFTPMLVPFLAESARSISNFLLAFLCAGVATGLAFAFVILTIKRANAAIQVIAALLIGSGAALILPRFLPVLHD